MCVCRRGDGRRPLEKGVMRRIVMYSTYVPRVTGINLCFYSLSTAAINLAIDAMREPWVYIPNSSSDTIVYILHSLYTRELPYPAASVMVRLSCSSLCRYRCGVRACVFWDKSGGSFSEKLRSFCELQPRTDTFSANGPASENWTVFSPKRTIGSAIFLAATQISGRAVSIIGKKARGHCPLAYVFPPQTSTLRNQPWPEAHHVDRKHRVI